MKKILFPALLVLSMSAYSQSEKKNQQKIQDDIFTGLKPENPTPVVFNSEEELNNKKAFKIENIKNQIRENINDTAKVRLLRYEIWRFENAIVQDNKSNK
ncbi:MAG: hypothetical protein IPM51_02430 [Sphingobacteriaceae bacterium]|nr:hypothetical protein [Sphingobacteriaceae bacterium]